MTLQHRGINRLGYVRLAVEDPEPALRFALDTLGLMELDSSRDDQGRAYLRCWHEPQAYSYVVEPGAPRLVEVGFQVRDDEDLHTAAARVRAAGVAVSEDPAGVPLRSLGRSISFDIPSGPSVRLFADMDTPGASVGNRAPDWNVPRELRATPAPLFLTHVAVTSPDPEAAIAFVREVLDFGVSELMTTDDGSRILSALLFRTNNGQDLAIYPGHEMRLHHVAFAKDDEIDVLDAGAMLRQDGVKIDIFGPTRQAYGRTFSLHFFDPCGIRFELCAGGRFSELHPQFQPVRWTEANLDKGLAFYDDVENKEFLEPSL